MSVLFVGHGSPMNAIEPGRFRDGWAEMGKKLGKPPVILAVSAHWFTDGLRVSDAEVNRQVFDMYGFPKELYDVKYAPKGDAGIAKKAAALTGASLDTTWGIDHGVWAVLCNMYPEADVPVVMMSINANASPMEQYETGKKLSGLRGEGVMIVASGNVVHNLRLVEWENSGGAPWAVDFDGYIKKSILEKRPMDAVNFNRSGHAYEKAIPTTDHYYPLLVALGAAGDGYDAEVWNEGQELGSMSMTSYIFR